MEKWRYARHEKLVELGKKGQTALLGASAAVVGCGGLGASISMLLARSGVGYITLFDHDIVEEHNLQRQTLYSEQDIGKKKAGMAKQRLMEINRDVAVKSHDQTLEHSNISLLDGADIILDATDNLSTRFLINDYCVKNNKPWIYGGAVATEGMTATFVPGPEEPCFRCLFPNMPPPGSIKTAESIGILGPLPTLVATVQVVEALKVLTGASHRRTLLYVDPWHGIWREAEIKKEKGCKCCGQHQYPFLDGKTEHLSARIERGGQVALTPSKKTSGLARALKKLYPSGSLQNDSFIISADGAELVVYDDGQALVMGLGEEEAKKLYSRYVGW